MASLATEIPLEFLRADAKLKMIVWIKQRNLPDRFARGILEAWAAAVDVTLYPTDYELVGKVGHT